MTEEYIDEDNQIQSRQLELIKTVEEEYNSDIYVFSAGVDYNSFGNIVRNFRRERPNALLIITTNGGLANAAYKIARFFQNQYDEFLVFIPSVCKSAGTLISIGAHKLIMGQFSELGPLDVQLYEKDEIFSRKSGLLSHSAFEALKHETFELYEHILLQIKQRSADNISFSVASTVAGEIAAQSMAPIFQQIAPNVLGSDFRDLQVAIHYGKRLAVHSQNISFRGVQILTEEFPSHDFIIDTEEASALFNHVEYPTGALWELIGTFGDFVFYESEPAVVLRVSDLTNNANEENDDAAEEGRDTHQPEMDSGAERDSPRANPTRSEGRPSDAEHERAVPAPRKSRNKKAT